ncbi:hypothetical protein HON36_02845 [Candidatus Parcubacteria bacterium]|jgi:hypothetical protein|nr:hypothetical protein [Candidatus Parcubacteria bacterium]MBT7228560.1 hypothetical protein [Candidatus Parcubacteria bacterium]
MEDIKTSPKSVRLFYFWAGIVATLAYRAIIVLNYYSDTWVKISWYVGTIGFILYFIHRFDISKKRSNLIVEHRLKEKLDANTLDELTPDDNKALEYILRTLVSSKERWNYYVIFILSGIALIAGILFDFVFNI